MTEANQHNNNIEREGVIMLDINRLRAVDYLNIQVPGNS
jgi:hypothetical protein